MGNRFKTDGWLLLLIIHIYLQQAAELTFKPSYNKFGVLTNEYCLYKFNGIDESILSAYCDDINKILTDYCGNTAFLKAIDSNYDETTDPIDDSCIFYLENSQIISKTYSISKNIAINQITFTSENHLVAIELSQSFLSISSYDGLINIHNIDFSSNGDTFSFIDVLTDDAALNININQCELINMKAVNGSIVNIPNNRVASNYRKAITLTFNECIIENNAAEYGGILYIERNNVYVTLSNSDIINNTVTGYGAGGVIHYICQEKKTDDYSDICGDVAVIKSYFHRYENNIFTIDLSLDPGQIVFMLDVDGSNFTNINGRIFNFNHNDDKLAPFGDRLQQQNVFVNVINSRFESNGHKKDYVDEYLPIYGITVAIDTYVEEGTIFTINSITVPNITIHDSHFIDNRARNGAIFHWYCSRKVNWIKDNYCGSVALYNNIFNENQIDQDYAWMSLIHHGSLIHGQMHQFMEFNLLIQDCQFTQQEGNIMYLEKAAVPMQLINTNLTFSNSTFSNSTFSNSTFSNSTHMINIAISMIYIDGCTFIETHDHQQDIQHSHGAILTISGLAAVYTYISRSTFLENQCSGGSAIFSADFAPIINITDSNFTTNGANLNGLFHIEKEEYGSMEIYDTIFEDNGWYKAGHRDSAHIQYGYDGPVSIMSTANDVNISLDIIRTTFKNNKNSKEGCFSLYESDVYIKDSIFDSNAGKHTVIIMFLRKGGDLIVSNSIFKNNLEYESPFGSSSRGVHGMFCLGGTGSIQISNTQYIDNYIATGAILQAANITVIHSTFVGNSGSSLIKPGDGSRTVSITNSYFGSNSVSKDALFFFDIGGYLSIKNSIITKNYGTIISFERNTHQLKESLHRLNIEDTEFSHNNNGHIISIWKHHSQCISSTESIKINSSRFINNQPQGNGTNSFVLIFYMATDNCPNSQMMYIYNSLFDSNSKMAADIYLHNFKELQIYHTKFTNSIIDNSLILFNGEYLYIEDTLWQQYKTKSCIQYYSDIQTNSATYNTSCPLFGSSSDINIIDTKFQQNEVNNLLHISRWVRVFINNSEFVDNNCSEYCLDLINSSITIDSIANQHKFISFPDINGRVCGLPTTNNPNTESPTQSITTTTTTTTTTAQPTSQPTEILTEIPTYSPLPQLPKCGLFGRKIDIVILNDISGGFKDLNGISTINECKLHQEMVSYTLMSLKKSYNGGYDLPDSRVAYIEYDDNSAQVIIGLNEYPYNGNNNGPRGSSLVTDEEMIEYNNLIKDRCNILNDQDLENRICDENNPTKLYDALILAKDEFNSNNIQRDRYFIIFSNCNVPQIERERICIDFEDYIRSGLDNADRGANQVGDGINAIMINMGDQFINNGNDYILCLVEYDEKRIYQTTYRNKEEFIFEGLENTIINEVCYSPTPSPTTDPTNDPTKDPTSKPTELKQETTTILPTPSPIMCDCKGGNYLDLILIIDLTAKLSINECNIYKQGIAELFASIKGEFTFPRVAVMTFDNNGNIEWIVHLNDRKYNDLTSKTGKIGLIGKKQYYDKIRDVKCNINDTRTETDTYSAIISAINEHKNSYNQREKKIVLFSTRSNTGNDICDDTLLMNRNKIEFIIFNIEINNGNIDINQYLKCLTNGDSSKMFGLPPPIDINKFYGVIPAFQREICFERDEENEKETECGCDNQNYQIVFDSVYHNDLKTTSMNNTDDCNGAHSNCDYSAKCYTYSIKQIEPFIFNKDCNDILSYIILSPKNDCKLKMDHFDYLRILHRIFNTQTGENIVDFDIIYNDDIDTLSKENGIKIPINFDENSSTFKFTICLYGITQFVTTNIGFGYNDNPQHQFGYHCHSTYLPDICQNDNPFFYAQSIINNYNNNNIWIFMSILVLIIMIFMNIFICNSSCIKNKNKNKNKIIHQYDVENAPIYQ